MSSLRLLAKSSKLENEKLNDDVSFLEVHLEFVNN